MLNLQTGEDFQILSLMSDSWRFWFIPQTQHFLNCGAGGKPSGGSRNDAFRLEMSLILHTCLFVVWEN